MLNPAIFSRPTAGPRGVLKRTRVNAKGTFDATSHRNASFPNRLGYVLVESPTTRRGEEIILVAVADTPGACFVITC